MRIDARSLHLQLLSHTLKGLDVFRGLELKAVVFASSQPPLQWIVVKTRDFVG